MNSIVRRVFLAALVTLPVVQSASAADAAAFPSRPIRLIVPYAPGGLADITARLIADALPARIGQPVVVENRAGANGAIGTNIVAKADPDGYTLALVVSSHVFGRALVPNLPFDPVKDFAPITQTVRTPIVLVSGATLPAKNLSEFITYAKAHPRELAFASAGNGSNVHVFGQWLVDQTGIHMIHVPYKGSTAAHLDLISGRVAIAFDSLASVQPHIAAGKMKLLAVGGSKRLAAYPDVPTVSESGVAGYQADSWGAVLAPAKTPQAVVDYLNREIVAVLKSDKVQERLKGAGAEVVAGSSNELREVLVTEEKRYGDLIKRLGITAD